MLAAVVACGTAVPLPGQASLILALDLPELVAQSDWVTVGEIVSVSAAWDKAHQRIWTTVQVYVAESWKGDTPADNTLTIIQPGGTVGDIELRVHGMPTFNPGERAVLFLRGDRTTATATAVGMTQGKRPLRFDPSGRRWWVDPGDGSGLVSLDPRGRAVAAPTQAPVVLEAFRRKIKDIAAPGDRRGR